MLMFIAFRTTRGSLSVGFFGATFLKSAPNIMSFSWAKCELN